MLVSACGVYSFRLFCFCFSYFLGGGGGGGEGLGWRVLHGVRFGF